MHRISLWAAASLAPLACHKDKDTEPIDSSAPPLTGTFAEIAGELGFTVQTGAVIRADDRDCCAAGANCWFSNPLAPYLAYALPPAPGQVVPDIGPLSAQGFAPNYHLRIDEAVVLLGVTPPDVRYLGATSYVGYRFSGDAFSIPRGSTGPSLNNAAMAAAMGPTMGLGTAGPLPPGTPYAVVTTLDGDVEDDVVDALVSSGVHPSAVFVDRIPPDLVLAGMTEGSDTFSHVIRAAGFADDDAGAAWLADPGGTLLRLTPAAERPSTAPHPRTPVPSRGSGVNEVGWVVAAADLGAAVRDRWPDRLHLETESEPQWVEPYDCIANGYCAFDTSDRYYAKSSAFALRDGEFVIAYGVNHERTGKAAFASVAVNDSEHLLEVTSLDGPALVGTAAGWLPGDPQADDLYVVAFARDCAALTPELDGAPCVEIEAGCPGADLAETLFLAYRAYLDPATGTGPTGSELALDRAIKFFAPLTPPPSTGSTGTTGDTGLSDTGVGDTGVSDTSDTGAGL